MLAKVQKIVHVMLGTKSEAPEFKTKQRLGFVHFISKPPWGLKLIFLLSVEVFLGKGGKFVTLRDGVEIRSLVILAQL